MDAARFFASAVGVLESSGLTGIRLRWLPLRLVGPTPFGIDPVVNHGNRRTCIPEDLYIQVGAG
ncbi:MAG: hypothetical protein WA873_11130 [Jannaschia helgolandensis]